MREDPTWIPPSLEGGSLAVIYQRTGEESPAVISWGPEQILRYKSDEVAQVCWYIGLATGMEIPAVIESWVPRVWVRYRISAHHSIPRTRTVVSQV